MNDPKAYAETTPAAPHTQRGVYPTASCAHLTVHGSSVFRAMKLRVNWANRGGVLQYMRGFADRAADPLMEGVGRAAIRVQAAMRENLEAMVYQKPISPGGYQRTRTLFRSTHAARPSNDHSGDEGRAFAGEDLAASEPLDVVERRGDQIMSEIGSWISYAEYVHNGVNQPSPRPFVSAAADAAEQIMEEEVAAAVIRAAAR